MIQVSEPFGFCPTTKFLYDGHVTSVHNKKIPVLLQYCSVHCIANPFGIQNIQANSLNDDFTVLCESDVSTSSKHQPSDQF